MSGETKTRRIERREWIFPAAIAVFFVLAGSIPYSYGYSHAKPGTRFMGFIGRGALHSHGYNMFIRQAQEGNHLFENKLTPEPLPRRYFHPEYWIVGKLARWTGLSLEAIFHVHRIAAVLALVFSIYFLAAQCLDTVFQRRLASGLILFGAGLGWIGWAYRHMGLPAIPPGHAAPPIVMRDIEGVTHFGYLMNKPHFMLAGAFIALAFAFAAAGEREKRTGPFVWCGLFALANVMVRAYAIFEIALVFAAFPLVLNVRDGRWDWSRIGRFALAGSFLAPAVAYYAYLSVTHTLGAGGYEVPPGRFLEYAIWYGIPFLLALLYFTGPGHFRAMDPALLLMTLWWMFGFLIAQAYPLVRAGEESAFYSFVMVSAILVAAGPLRLDWMPRRTAALAAIVFVLACSLSNGIVYARFFTRLDTQSDDYYLDNDTHAAMKWLEQNTARGDLVFSGPVTCPILSAVAGNKTFTGHDYLTTRRWEKDTMARRFFEQRDDVSFKRQLLSQYRVRYILEGAWERRLGGFNAAALPELERVFALPNAAVYRVK
ncbi:MAG TPA: hypothetical protein P5318_18405 [Candidatus Hydrogenedentes bacterium]|nr:hypothetical protein [Candidatus Hydrogenedentota bacterium]HRT22086.1 hypothetical protein [Candidatus Hydrogenedentota bacterium]HRT66844.1 hypothetical protein [Candidatus Hydrogenedentota bacterium]